MSGEVTPQPLSANVALKLDGIELKAVQPYIGQHTSMTLLGGRLSGDAKVRYGAKKPALQVRRQYQRRRSAHGRQCLARGLHQLGSIGHVGGRLSTRSRSARHPANHGPQTVRPRHHRAGHELECDAGVDRPWRDGVAPAAPRRSPWRHGAGASRCRAGKAAGTQVAGQVRPARTGAAPMPMSIKKIVFHAGQAHFADLSVQPNFSAGIQSIEGTVLGLSSKTNSRANVDIHGAVDAFSPVSISGEVNVLSAALYTDLALSFRNMELSTFNPYSGKFAGYNITKGKLTTELHYKVEGRKLDAQHHITIEQLEFGEKTASKDAVSLPIKLAVALLKDRNGVIDLDLPVTGTLDDPTVSPGTHHLEGLRQHSREGGHRALRLAWFLVRRRPGFAVHRFSAGSGGLGSGRGGQGPGNGQGAERAAAAEDRGAHRARWATSIARHWSRRSS